MKKTESIERELDCEDILHKVIDALKAERFIRSISFSEVDIQEDEELPTTVDCACEFTSKGLTFEIHIEPNDEDYDEYYAIIENLDTQSQKVVKIYHLIDMEDTEEWENSISKISSFLL